jgi:hypothetical protein
MGEIAALGGFHGVLRPVVDPIKISYLEVRNEHDDRQNQESGSRRTWRQR